MTETETRPSGWENCPYCYLEREARHIEELERKGLVSGDSRSVCMRVAGIAIVAMRSVINMRMDPCEAHDTQAKRVLRARLQHEQARKLMELAK